MTQKQYIKEILQRSCLPAMERRRLKRDLESDINAALERGESFDEIMARMGEPDKVAAALYEGFTQTTLRPFREYKSEATLFGLPLVHIIRMNHGYGVQQMRAASARVISVGGRYGNYVNVPTARGIFAFGPKAKGFVAIGNFAAGFVAIGNICAGLFSIGNVAAGLCSIGNFALALYLVLGNLAAGWLSFGNLAAGYAAAGNLAIGQYAVGNEVRGAITFAIDNLAAQFETMRLFFAELVAPPQVKGFYEMVEGLFAMFLDPMSALPLILTLAVVIAASVVLAIVVPRRLLDREGEG